MKSNRIFLRELNERDESQIVVLLADKEISSNTLSIPFPLPDGWVRKWIEGLSKNQIGGHPTSFSISLMGSNQTIGVISLLDVDNVHNHAELGFLIGKRFWGRGYATEASKLLLNHGFHTLQLHRVFAYHFSHNIASKKVLKKLGMVHEGSIREHVKKDGRYLNSELYGILKNEFVIS